MSGTFNNTNSGTSNGSISGGLFNRQNGYNYQGANIAAINPAVSSAESQLRSSSAELVSRMSNLGSANVKKGPTARTLFYNAGFYNTKDAKYGQFLLYSFGNNENNFIQEYYRSENREFNSSISPVDGGSVSGGSKNPSAGQLVRMTQRLLTEMQPSQNDDQSPGSLNTRGNRSTIIGGLSAPYYWKDFLYCKYYGTIPNNYMVTLRRFPAPMRDNLSIPEQLLATDLYKNQGAGRPVAQAVTWWGGNTGNSLSTVINFSSGLNWDPKTQEDTLYQKGMDQGFFKSVLGRAFAGAASGAGAGELLAQLGDVANLAVAATDGGRSEVTIPKINFALRDKMTREGGPLSDFLFVSVDTVDKTYVRGRGLNFSTDTEITLDFHYELTSVGEVNTKAALLDIMGNLLAIGTNYGQFLSPDIRYDNGFPAIGFPGGNDGLVAFYSNPIEWTKTAIKYLADPDGSTMNNPQAQEFRESMDRIDQAVADLQTTIKQLAENDLGQIANMIDDESGLGNIIAFSLADDFIENIQLPVALQTGAPTGEWHLVVGNPTNPIAMIGNLICTGVDISFGEVLGPDDFPTEITAKFTLKHGRDRERGEIESMFNRGDGRLYQSSLPTYANNQSIYNIGTSDGNTIPLPLGSDPATIVPTDIAAQGGAIQQ
jgi:hypothetical protein